MLSAVNVSISKLKPTSEIIELRLANYEINHCRGCTVCGYNGDCVIKDDMKIILDHVLKSDLICIATPNYYYSVSGIVKDFIDRNVSRYESKEIRGKKVIGIISQDSEGAEFVEQTLKNYSKLSHMNYLGSIIMNEKEVLGLEYEELEKICLEKIKALLS